MSCFDHAIYFWIKQKPETVVIPENEEVNQINEEANYLLSFCAVTYVP